MQNEQPAGVVESFKDFVSHERQRLVQKKQAIQKSEKDKRLADLVKFSANFKVCASLCDGDAIFSGRNLIDLSKSGLAQQTHP